MRSLMTISILEFEGANGAVVPIAVVNWDENEDGDIEALLSSKRFYHWAGINLKNESGADEQTARLAAARNFFLWRDTSEEERRGWQSAYDRLSKEDDSPPFFLLDPLAIPH